MPRKVIRISRTIDVYFAFASKLKNNFSTSSYRDKHVGKLFSFIQNENEKIRITRGTTDDGCFGLKANFQKVEEK